MTLIPVPNTAIVRPFALNAPWRVAESVPHARPLTTGRLLTACLTALVFTTACGYNVLTA